MKFAIGTAFLAAASLLSPAASAQTVVRPRSGVVTTSNPPYLGISSKDIDAEGAKALKLPEVRGVEVMNVTEDSPASKAGFKDGDVVLEYNGQKVEGSEQLARLVRETPVGRQVRVLISRNGATMTLTPTIEAGKGYAYYGGGSWNMPEVNVPEITIPPMPPMELPRFQMSYQNPMLGILGEPLGQEAQFAEFFGVQDGVLVKQVNRDSAAEKAGIKVGDVITKIDDTKVSNTRDITSALRSARGKKTVTVVVIRARKEMPITVTVEATSTGSIKAWAAPMDWGTWPEVVVTMPALQIDIPRLIISKPLTDKPLFKLLKFTPQDRVI